MSAIINKLSEKASEINLFVKLRMGIPQNKKKDEKPLKNCVKNFITKYLHYTRTVRNIFCYDKTFLRFRIFNN